MTITTELAQRMREAAKQSADAHRDLVGMEVATESFDFIQLATPVNVLALLDALEAAEKSNAFLKEQLAQLASFNPDWDKLEAATDSIREHMVELIAARNRIAELEALAGMESEPVYQMRLLDGSPEENLWVEVTAEEFNLPLKDPSEWDKRILYTALHPLTTSERAELENYRNAQQVVCSITQHFDGIALETAREIMCDVNRRNEFLGGDVQLLSRIQCRIDDAIRAAMLQGDKS